MFLSVISSTLCVCVRVWLEVELDLEDDHQLAQLYFEFKLPFSTGWPCCEGALWTCQTWPQHWALQKRGSALGNMFSLRIVSTSHYQAEPLQDLDVLYSSFRSTDVRRVPILRIFGATPAGDWQACVRRGRVKVVWGLFFWYVMINDLPWGESGGGGGISLLCWAYFVLVKIKSTLIKRTV